MLFLSFIILVCSARGEGFHPPVDISLPGENTYIPKIVIDRNGLAICVWQQTDDGIIQAARTADSGVFWKTPVNLSDINSVNPQIALSSSKIAICVWEKVNEKKNDGSHIVQTARSVDGGLTWDLPVNLSSIDEDARHPQIVFNGSKEAICVWDVDKVTNRIIEASQTSDGGASWITPIDISMIGINEDDFCPQIAFDGSHNVICVWERFSGTNYELKSSRTVDGGASWETPIEVSSQIDTRNPKIAFDKKGNAVCVWERQNGIDDPIIQSSRTVDGGVSWETPVDVSLPGGAARDSQIAFDSSGNGICIWSRNEIIQSSKTIDSGASWKTPIDLSGDNAEFPQIAFNESGLAFCVWDRNINANNLIQASTTADGGSTWKMPVSISIQDPSPNGRADRAQIAFDGNGKGLCVWERYNGTNVTTQASRILLSPFSLSAFGKQKSINHLFGSDIINQIFWNSIPTAKFYRVFDNNHVLVFQGNSLSFFDHYKRKGVPYTYFLTWTDETGNESNPVTLEIP